MGGGVSIETSQVDLAAHVTALGNAYEPYAKAIADNGIDGKMLLDYENVDSLLTDLTLEANALHKKKLNAEFQTIKSAAQNPSHTGTSFDTTALDALVEQAKNIVVKELAVDDDDINHANIRLLIGRMAKAYLNKKITKSTSQVMVDDTIADLFDKGYWTVETLEKAKEELVENGLFERPAPNRISTPQPQQVAAPSGPSEPVASRIAAAPGQPVGFGLPARSSSPAAIPESQPLSDVDLQKLPMDQLKAIALAQLKAQMQGRQ